MAKGYIFDKLMNRKIEGETNLTTLDEVKDAVEEGEIPSGTKLYLHIITDSNELSSISYISNNPTVDEVSADKSIIIMDNNENCVFSIYAYLDDCNSVVYVNAAEILFEENSNHLYLYYKPFRTDTGYEETTFDFKDASVVVLPL